MERVGNIKGMGGACGKPEGAIHPLQADMENFCPNKLLGKWIEVKCSDEA